MKKKLPIRVVVVLLCAAMLCGVPAHAAETRASERIDLSASTIEKTSSGYLLAYFMVQANDVMDVIGATSVEIQRYSLFNWVTEYTFTSEDIPELLTTMIGGTVLGCAIRRCFRTAHTALWRISTQKTPGGQVRSGCPAVRRPDGSSVLPPASFTWRGAAPAAPPSVKEARIS